MSGQTQPETALQALAEKLRTDAIAIFGEGLADRDIIEWFYGAMLAAAPAQPAAQHKVHCSECGLTVLDCDKRGCFGLAAAHDQGEAERMLSAEDVRRACQDTIEVFAEQPDAEQCREAAEYMREVLLALIARRTALAASTGQEVKP